MVGALVGLKPMIQNLWEVFYPDQKENQGFEQVWNKGSWATQHRGLSWISMWRISRLFNMATYTPQWRWSCKYGSGMGDGRQFQSLCWPPCHQSLHLLHNGSHTCHHTWLHKRWIPRKTWILGGSYGILDCGVFGRSTPLPRIYIYQLEPEGYNHGTKGQRS